MLIVGGTLWVSQDFLWNVVNHGGTGPIRAALVDPLSETLPDQAFLTTTTTILQSDGYVVDYYSPGDSTVQLFRDLPLKNYGLVIIRAHTSPAIFTGELYSDTKYPIEQLADELEIGAASEAGFHFAITDRFVRFSMRGTFSNTIIVNLGCSGLGTGSPIAQAFIDKGAKAYVGWDAAVTVSHTDNTILSFLRKLSEGNTVQNSVSLSMKALGPDPVYHSQLTYLDGTILAQQRFSERLVTLGGLGILMLFLLPVIAILYGLRRLGKN